MKLIKFIAVVAAGLLANHAPAALGPTGPLTIQLTGKGQDQDDVQIKSNPPTFKWSTTNVTYTTEDILGLLANSFNTNFPSGAGLMIDACGSIAVKDGNGFFLYVGSVLSLQVNQAVISGQNVDSASGGMNVQLTAQASLRYDDESKTTGDGTTSSFTLTGQFLERQTFSNHSGDGESSFTLQGSGNGTVRNRFFVFKGKASGKAPGTCF
jgi:hypothetical protein